MSVKKNKEIISIQGSGLTTNGHEYTQIKKYYMCALVFICGSGILDLSYERAFLTTNGHKYTQNKKYYTCTFVFICGLETIDHFKLKFIRGDDMDKKDLPIIPSERGDDLHNL
ncbi:MAG: hypothetical protein PVF36_00200, partial [Desulfobacterales bacterium]